MQVFPRRLYRCTLFLALGGLLGLGGCATSQPAPEPEQAEPQQLVWPQPPETPRIRYIRSYSSTAEFDEKKSSLTDILAGADEDKVTRLDKPYGVYADTRGRVFVADTQISSLVVFDPVNKRVEFWGESGSGALAKPQCVTGDAEGNIYVVDSAAKRVVVFGPDGRYLRAFGGRDVLVNPAGIAVRPDNGQIYVVDVAGHDIKVFDASGKLAGTLGERGTESGQFNFPTNLAFDRLGNLYVADSMNFRVQIFGPAFEHTQSIGQAGNNFGDFYRLRGVAVDSEANIYGVDASFNNFQIFDQQGQLLLWVGERGSSPGQFGSPAGIYIDADDRIYVADQFNRKIQVFQYLPGGSGAEPVDALSPEEN